MIPKETRSLFGIVTRYPRTVAAVWIPAILCVVAACFIHRFSLASAFLLLWSLLVSLFIVHGVKYGQLTDNSGTASRRQKPLRFWAKVTVWSAAYIIALICIVASAVQERNKGKAEPAAGALRQRKDEAHER